MAKNYDIMTIKKAIEGSGGLYTKISAKLGCNWNTARSHVEKHAETIEAFNNESEKILDLAESKLIENINDNDNTAIIFYLKTKGKKRGYIERNEVEHSGEIKTNTDLSKLSTAELIERANALEKLEKPIDE